MADEIDWDNLDITDPCAVYYALYPAYLKLLAGESEQEVEIDGRRVRFSPRSLNHAEQHMQRLKMECENKTGKRRVRRAAPARFI